MKAPPEVLTVFGRGILLPLLLLFLFFFPGSGPACSAYTEEDICTRSQSLCAALREEGFSQELPSLFADPRVTLYPGILEKRGKGLDYFSKKFGLLSADSVERGRALLRGNRGSFTDIEQRYHVEPEVLVAVFRVETNFGKYVGTYPVFNSLLTMAVLENRRSEWAGRELVSLMRIARAEGIDPLSIKGSWAGAFGLCQFIPSSYLTYGADGNSDGKIDLFQFHDAMASIARYLSENGWKSGDRERMRKAVYSYNHCDNYVSAVLAYADSLDDTHKYKKPSKKKKPAHARKKKKSQRV